MLLLLRLRLPSITPAEGTVRELVEEPLRLRPMLELYEEEEGEGGTDADDDVAAVVGVVDVAVVAVVAVMLPRNAVVVNSVVLTIRSCSLVKAFFFSFSCSFSLAFLSISFSSALFVCFGLDVVGGSCGCSKYVAGKA